MHVAIDLGGSRDHMVHLDLNALASSGGFVHVLIYLRSIHIAPARFIYNTNISVIYI